MNGCDNQADHRLKTVVWVRHWKSRFRLKPATSHPTEVGLSGPRLEVVHDLERLVCLGMLLDVLPYHFVRYVPRRAREIASCPHSLAPVLFPQRSELSLQLV